MSNVFTYHIAGYFHMDYMITLCMFEQQSYAFGCVGLYIIMYNICHQKIDLFSALPFKKVLLSVLYYLLV